MATSIKDLIRTIPDYPETGILFRDITTLLEDPGGFRLTIDEMLKPLMGLKISKVAGIEARGFIIGGAIAYELGVGFVPIRKKGKLPWDVISQDYQLEYGTDTVEIHTDSIKPDETILLVDDLLATGGTVCAAIELVQRSQGKVVGCSFIVDLPDLGGQKKVLDRDIPMFSLCEFEGL
jgi:adenine phosphoribosyltransferase